MIVTITSSCCPHWPADDKDENLSQGILCSGFGPGFGAYQRTDL